MTMKWYQKLHHYWNLAIRLFCLISVQSLEESYLSAEMKPVYSTTPAIRQYTGLNVKTVFISDNSVCSLTVKAILFPAIQFSISTHFQSQKGSFLNNSVKQFKC